MLDVKLTTSCFIGCTISAKNKILVHIYYVMINMLIQPRSPCQQFHQDPTINPHTGRTIKIGAETYNRLVRECGPPPNTNINTTIIPLQQDKTIIQQAIQQDRIIQQAIQQDRIIQPRTIQQDRIIQPRTIQQDRITLPQPIQQGRITARAIQQGGIVIPTTPLQQGRITLPQAIQQGRITLPQAIQQGNIGLTRIAPIGPKIPEDMFNKRLSENIILSTNEQNVDELIQRYGVILPPKTGVLTRNPFLVPNNMVGFPTKLINGYTVQERLNLFINQISEYDSVLTRTSDIGPPPILGLLRSKSNNERVRLLSKYTTKELIDTYGTLNFYPWNNRTQLITQIINIALNGPQWGTSNSDCMNDDAITVTEGERYGDVDKNDPLNPILSFGYPDYYRCYQVNELALYFRMDDDTGIFKFSIPDYNRNNRGIDLSTGEEYREEFTDRDIEHLVALLNNLILVHPRTNANLQDLRRIINDGLYQRRNANYLTRELIDTYNTFTPDQQYLVKLFGAWVFLYSMWMYFWKGPGYPWPENINVGVVQTCHPDERNEHIFIQNSVLTALKEIYEVDLAVKHWIEQIPIIANVGGEKLVRYLERFLLGENCMGYGAEVLIKIGYSIIMYIIRAEDFDQFIAEMLPPLLDIERQVVMNQLAGIKDPYANQLRIRVLRQRLQELNRPLRPQGKFNIHNIGKNIHIG